MHLMQLVCARWPDVASGTADPIFYGGSFEDLTVLREMGAETMIVNRFDSATPVSATEVRDILIRNDSLEDKIDERIIQNVRPTFKREWERFKTL